MSSTFHFFLLFWFGETWCWVFGDFFPHQHLTKQKLERNRIEPKLNKYTHKYRVHIRSQNLVAVWETLQQQQQQLLKSHRITNKRKNGNRHIHFSNYFSNSWFINKDNVVPFEKWNERVCYRCDKGSSNIKTSRMEGRRETNVGVSFGSSSESSYFKVHVHKHIMCIHPHIEGVPEQL